MDILREVMDASTHAMFLTDAHGIVTHINTQAQERFGLAGQSSRSHKAGRLSTGDIVILADTAIGADDGELTPHRSGPPAYSGAEASLRRYGGRRRRL